MTRFNHDVNQVLPGRQAAARQGPAGHLQRRPGGARRPAGSVSASGGSTGRCSTTLVRLLTGSAADFLDDYFESDILKGYLASSSIIGTKVGPYSQGSGLVLLYHIDRRARRRVGRLVVPQAGNGGFTQVLSRAAQALGAEIGLDSAVDHVITRDGRATGVALADGTEFLAPVVVSALDPRRTFMELVEPRELPTDLVENIRRSASRAPRPRSTSRSTPPPKYPALGDRTDQYRGFTNIGPSILGRLLAGAAQLRLERARA